MAQRPDTPPPAGVLLIGGVGVVIVLGFVVALALGGGSRETPGERVAVVTAEGDAQRIAVLAGRCREQRVMAVEVRDTEGEVRWRIDSRKGSIDRRYEVGGTPPLGFEATTELQEPIALPGVALVTFDRPGRDPETDQRAFDPAALPAEEDELDAAPPPCGGRRDTTATVALFALGALVVVAGYAVMVGRWLAGRRR